MTIARYGGAAFLIGYGLLAARRALRPQVMTSSADGPARLSVLATCLALTFLNPHVYLDTVILLGTLANQQGDVNAGRSPQVAAAASVVWFFGLGFGARRLAGFVRLARPGGARRTDRGHHGGPGFVAVSDIGSRCRAQPTRVPGLAGAAALTAACSRDGATGDSNGKAVIEHVFGETTVPSPPAKGGQRRVDRTGRSPGRGRRPCRRHELVRRPARRCVALGAAEARHGETSLLNLDNGIQVDRIAA